MAKKILIIDDDPVIVKYLQKLFNDNGYKTSVAYDGLEAGETAKKEKPDLITIDLEMPREWGTQFYRKLTKYKEFKDIPVIVISGLTGRENSIRKAVACFPKPFEPDKLIDAVRSVIG